MSDKKVYAVLRLSQSVTVEDSRTNDKKVLKIDGIFGFIPVFETLEEAEKESAGDFEILTLII